ncbi:hypothetical protein J2W42_003060 [Rhizobium tibeticum]|nr:hypothetical protein [Rhizobium tibeticum]
MDNALSSAGFSCNAFPGPFKCVKLDCEQSAFGRGALLQWYVGIKPNRSGGVVFAPSYINYGALMECPAETDVKEMEQRVLNGEGVE